MPPGTCDGVDHPIDVDLALEAVPLDRHLPPDGRLLDQAGAAADAGQLGWKVQQIEHAAERVADPPDALPIVAAASASCRGSSARNASSDDADRTGLSHTGIAQAGGQHRVVQVEQAEAGDLVDHLRLLEPAPVLVLALHHRLEAGPTQPEPLAQDRDHRADREVPEPDDSVHRTLSNASTCRCAASRAPAGRPTPRRPLAVRPAAGGNVPAASGRSCRIRALWSSSPSTNTFSAMVCLSGRWLCRGSLPDRSGASARSVARASFRAVAGGGIKPPCRSSARPRTRVATPARSHLPWRPGCTACSGCRPRPATGPSAG